MPRLLISFLALLGLMCQSIEKPPRASDRGEGTEEALPDDFVAFYQKFHDDSIFQIQHIQFPLAGLPPNADTLSISPESFRWQKESWKPHQPLMSNLQGYEQSFHKFDEGIIIERILQTTTGLGMERRFAKFDTSWILIYYAGMNFSK